jgi:hypothetical protein
VQRKLTHAPSYLPNAGSEPTGPTEEAAPSPPPLWPALPRTTPAATPPPAPPPGPAPAPPPLVDSVTSSDSEASEGWALMEALYRGARYLLNHARVARRTQKNNGL